MRGAGPGAAASNSISSAEFARDGTLAAIAAMLKSGITCFCDRYYFPEETASVAYEQGMRAMIGMPVTDSVTPWAKDGAEYLTRALELRDEHKGDPLISTAFAPLAPSLMSDATFSRLATLADELDAGIMVDLQSSAHEIAECIAAHGMRPLERLWKSRIADPRAQCRAHGHAAAADLDLAQRTGIAISLCREAASRANGRLPPVAAFARPACDWDGLGRRCLPGARSMGRNEIACTAASAWDALRAATSAAPRPWGLKATLGSGNREMGGPVLHRSLRSGDVSPSAIP